MVKVSKVLSREGEGGVPLVKIGRNGGTQVRIRVHFITCEEIKNSYFLY